MSRLCRIFASGLLAVMMVGPALAQQPADSIRAAALRDYHGPDLEGKDGSLAKVGLDLLVLYHEYRAAQKQDERFEPSLTDLQVRDESVTVDAVAANDAAQLREDLTALGFESASTAGRIVSGQLPIERIPALAEVESLRGVAPSRMQTRSDRSTSRRTERADTGAKAPSPPEPPAPDSEAEPPEDQTQARSPQPSDSATGESDDREGLGTGGILVGLSVLLGLLGLFFFARR